MVETGSGSLSPTLGSGPPPRVHTFHPGLLDYCPLPQSRFPSQGPCLGWVLLPPAGVSGKSDPCAPGPLSLGAPLELALTPDLSGLRTLYLRAGPARLLSMEHGHCGGSRRGGTGLQEQQMSRGDIPTIIVDACISFVTQHGEWVLADTELVRDGEHGHCWLDGIEEEACM